MDEIKVLFVGIGSIAKRHIRNLYAVARQREISITIDAFRRNSSNIPTDGIRHEYTELANVPSDYDAVFITNPTEQHLETLRVFHNKGKNFFIEKPVVSLTQIEVAKKFALRSDCVYYVACPLRYNAVVQYIKENVPADEVISVRCISSSYLPDWRPGQDYRKTYSAHRNMGGGVSIDLIHEWDYLTFLFGKPERVQKYIGKKSDLEIESDDYAIYIAEFADKIAELHLDYFGRKTIREIQLFLRNDTIIGDIYNNNILHMVSGECIDFHEERDDYQKRELSYFLSTILGETSAEGGFHQGIEVLELTQGNI